MIPDKMLQVLKHEGVVAIATQGDAGPHLINTWNSYIQITKDEKLLIPAGYMHATEANVARDSRCLITVGSRDVEGRHGAGTGFLVEGTAVFIKSGPQFDAIKEKFPWARAALEIGITSVTQTL